MDNVKCISWWPNNHSKTEGVAQRKEQNGGSSSLVVLMAEQVSKYWNSLGSFSQKKNFIGFLDIFFSIGTKFSTLNTVDSHFVIKKIIATS